MNVALGAIDPIRADLASALGQGRVKEDKPRVLGNKILQRLSNIKATFKNVGELVRRGSLRRGRESRDGVHFRLSATGPPPTHPGMRLGHRRAARRSGRRPGGPAGRRPPGRPATAAAAAVPPHPAAQCLGGPREAAWRRETLLLLGRDRGRAALLSARLSSHPCLRDGVKLVSALATWAFPAYKTSGSQHRSWSVCADGPHMTAAGKQPAVELVHAPTSHSLCAICRNHLIGNVRRRMLMGILKSRLRILTNSHGHPQISLGDAHNFQGGFENLGGNIERCSIPIYGNPHQPSPW